MNEEKKDDYNGKQPGLGFNDDGTQFMAGGNTYSVVYDKEGNKYLPAEAAKDVIKSHVSDTTPFESFETGDSMEIFGRNYPMITDPETGATFVDFKALGAMQDELSKIQNTKIVDGAKPGDLVYLDTGSEFVLGEVKKNLPSSITLDGALTVNHLDYQGQKKEMEQKWFPSNEGELEKTVDDSGEVENSREKEKIRPPQSSLSFMLFKYLTEQDITRSAKVGIVKDATRTFFSNKYPEDPEYVDAVNDFHVNVTKAVAARDIVNGYQIKDVKSALNLSQIPEEGIEENEVYQTIESLWNLWRKGEGETFKEEDKGSYDNAPLKEVSDQGNGHAAIAQDLSTPIQKDEKFKKELKSSDGGFFSEDQPEESVPDLPEEELKPLRKFKGWEGGSWMDNNYDAISESVDGLLNKFTEHLPKLDGLYRSRRGVTSETADKDKDSALSIAKLGRGIVKRAEEEGDEKLSTFNYTKASGGNEFLLPENLSDIMTLLGAYLRLPKFNPKIKPEDTGSENIFNDDLNALSSSFADHIEKEGEKIRVSWDRSSSENTDKLGFQPLKRGNKLTDMGEALCQIARSFDLEKESQQEIVEQTEKIFQYDLQARENKDPQETLIEMAENAKQKQSREDLKRIQKIANLVLSDPEGFTNTLRERKIIK